MSAHDTRLTDEVLRAQLNHCLEGTNLARELGTFYQGKVRDNYTKAGRRTLVATDRISAFDVVLGTIPFKGQVLNQLAAYWFDALDDLCPSHVIEVPDANVTVGVECKPIHVEMVVRAYLTGVTTTSIWYAYERGARLFCGHVIPDGMKKNQPLPHAIVTPSTKAEKGGHDVSVSRAQVLEMNLCTPDEFDVMDRYAQTMFARGAELLKARGLILVDTKYEFGFHPDGRIVVIDEVHTPDSSRLWHLDSYDQRLAEGQEPQALDKEYVRRHLADQGYRGDGPPPR
jgi:phosphoribosylaminoimidazole-succinocarboxamide synthase